jgi:hypothetical protein
LIMKFTGDFYERARVNVRAKERAVNSVFLVQLRKIVATDFADRQGWKPLSEMSR